MRGPRNNLELVANSGQVKALLTEHGKQLRHSEAGTGRMFVV